MPQVITYGPAHFAGLEALWREAFPDYPPRNAAAVAVPAKLAIQPDLFLVAVEGDWVLGSVMAGYDGHRGWLYSVAVLAACRRRGIGAALVREAETRLAALGCPKINLQILPANAAVAGFYEAMGYAVEPRISMGKALV